MFLRGSIKEDGVDITIKNNPNHFLAPNDWDMVLKARCGKISGEEYKKWYLNLIKDRWTTRQDEFKALAQEGLTKDIKLLCFCSKYSSYCHAKIAADFMNALAKKMKPAQNLSL
jgi:hypothetical protein